MSLNFHFREPCTAPRATPQWTGRGGFAEISNHLRSEPCVSFVLVCAEWVDFSPELDVAVRLLSIAARNRPVDDGHLIWGLQDEWVTPASMESGKQAIIDSLSRLRQSGLPFEFLAHVEGQLEIEIHFSLEEAGFPLRKIAEALADEVRTLSA